MNAGVSFQPGVQGDTGQTTQAAFLPLQSAVKVLSFNLPVAAAQARFSPLAAGSSGARGFNPETIVAQTLLRSLAGGQPNETLMGHLTSLLSSMSDPNAAPNVAGGATPGTGAAAGAFGSLTPTITPGSQGPSRGVGPRPTAPTTFGVGAPAPSTAPTTPGPTSI